MSASGTNGVLDVTVAIADPILGVRRDAQVGLDVTWFAFAVATPIGSGHVTVTTFGLERTCHQSTSFVLTISC